MKKATIILLILVSAFTVSAVSVKAGLGVISSLGVSFNTGRWDFSTSMLSSFPIILTAMGIEVPSCMEGVCPTGLFKD